ncbi:MAG: SAM-dependent methyltransferase, partial [SAR324 cluster bacterium]|nr:SAM-dependent methyltransferase [SAR324 cluster bacterium]
FPLREIVTPRFEIRTEWSLEHYLGFLKSMSAVRKYRQQAKQDPLLTLEEKLKSLWGNTDEKRNVVFPLFTKMGILT